jgi:hypothetical protein
MDQHSPEEIARYFETHKHEIPRSHEICVKRYQRNEEDVRKLDAKYGSFASMITGLGQKHRPILAVKEKLDFLEAENKPTERVENWANTVSADGVEDTEIAVLPEEVREGRFDRPMKEIRVGESPSRPWGISVPFKEQKGPLHSCPPRPTSQPVLAEVKTTATPPIGEGGCPFLHSQKPKEESRQDTHPKPVFLQHPEITKMASSGGPRVIFTGPVFIGYPIENAMTFLREWQAGMPRTEGP